MDTKPASLDVGLSNPSAHPVGMDPFWMSGAFVCVILGTSVSARAKNIPPSIPSIPREDHRFIFSSAMCTSSTLRGRNSVGASLDVRWQRRGLVVVRTLCQ